jgi:hypothetical protein
MPLKVLQTFVQLPQAVTLVLVLTSQPSAAFLLQSPNPGAHVMPQTPAVQVGVPFVPLHTVLQVPQWFALVFKFVSQPLAALLSQSPVPGAHVIPHTPAAQVGVPPAVEHGFAQALQLLTSFMRLTSQPLDAFPSQSAKPALQVPIVQTPLAQVAEALAKLHLLPHKLQLLASVFRLASQPFVDDLSQSP